MVRFLLGRSGSGKTTQVLREVSEAAHDGKKNIILLVPEQQSHAMERMLCEAASNSISASAEVTTFRRLCRLVAAQAGGLSKTLLDDGARIIYMHQAVGQARCAFKVLKNASARPEFLDTLLAFVDRVKDSGLLPEELMEKAAEFPKSLREKLEDISVLYACYQASVGNGGIDATGQIQKLAEDLLKTEFFAGKTVWVDGFTGFTGIEYKILKTIFAQAEQVTVSICADTEDESAAFAKANETFKRLQSFCVGKNQVIRLEENQRATNKAFEYLEKNIISDEDVIPFEGDAPIELSECENIYRECEFAASRILELVRNENYRFRDIAVSVRDVDAYADTVEAVFAYYGVPVYLSRKSPVLEKAAVSVAVNALKCISGDFRYDDVLRYIKNGLIGISRKGCDILEEYMSVWHLRGADWSGEKGFTKHPLGYGVGEDENSARLLKILNRLRDKVRIPLINLKNAMKENPTGQGCACALFNYFENIGLAVRLELRAAALRARGDLQGAEEYASLWQVLCDCVNSIGKVLGDTHFEIDEFCRLFALVLSKYEVGTIPTALDRVSLGDLSRPGMLGQVRCQIILGVNDGVVPKVSSENAIFTENEFRIMTDAGIEIAPDLKRGLEEEFRLVYMGMTSARERLIVSKLMNMPSGEKGRESFIYTRLREMFPSISVKRAGAEVQATAVAPCFDATVQGGDEWKGAREWFSKCDEWGRKLKLAERGRKVLRGPIKDRDNIRAIFGGEIRLSASRADVFGACRYRYFLQYGLKLKKIEPAKLDAPVAGTLIHYILEKTMVKIVELGGTKVVTPEQVEKIARDAAYEYAEEMLGGFESKTQRFKFLFERLCKTAVAVAKDIREELNASSFRPLSFELKVSDSGGHLPAVRLSKDGARLKLEGFIDRVDGMEMPDGRLCVRVVDYKTGKKEFRMDEVLNGLNIQLLVYLFALEKEGEKLYGKEIVPAGVLYVPARNPELAISGSESAEEIANLHDKAVKRKGVLVNDENILREMEHGIEKEARFLPFGFGKDGNPSARSSVISEKNFKKLKEHIDDTLGTIAVTLTNGDIDANPYYKSRTDSACVNCPYWSACMFDGKAGDKARYLYKNNAAEFFCENTEEVNEHGGC